MTYYERSVCDFEKRKKIYTRLCLLFYVTILYHTTTDKNEIEPVFYIMLILSDGLDFFLSHH